MNKQIISIVEDFGGRLAVEGQSSLSISSYLKFDGINTAMPKSRRRAFFVRFPKANGSTDGRFSIRISDHAAVSCRESSMFTFRLDQPAKPQLSELCAMLAYLTGRGA